MDGRCGHWIGAERRYCGSADQVREFLPGPRCVAHTPNALKGLPEVPPGPGWPRHRVEPPPTYRTPTVRDRRHLTVVKTSEENR